MKLLFVDACPRREASRTLRLARVFTEELARACPRLEIARHCLPAMALRPEDAETLALKEALCDRQDWEHPLLRVGRELRQADAVVVAAPYWDLSFPSMLKVWVEHAYVRNLTFRYEADRCVGLCRGREAAYITTAGSPIGPEDWGTGYIRAVLRTLGNPGFISVRAEALDLEGRDAEAILLEAEHTARREAQWMAQRLTARA